MQGNEAMAPGDVEHCRFIVDEGTERECDGLSWGWWVLYRTKEGRGDFERLDETQENDSELNLVKNTGIALK